MNRRWCGVAVFALGLCARVADAQPTPTAAAPADTTPATSPADTTPAAAPAETTPDNPAAAGTLPTETPPPETPPATAPAARPAVAMPPPPSTKKDLYLAAKRATDDKAAAAWRAQLDKRVGRPPPEVINLYNTWTKEFVAIEADGRATIAPESANALLRCHFTNEPTAMDERLVANVLKAARHFGKRRVDIVSGFRAPKYNLLLRKKGREVARDSQHTHGTAIDFRLPGVSVKTLHGWAKQQRLGGVGLYSRSGFIHMDTARVRYWGGE